MRVLAITLPVFLGLACVASAEDKKKEAAAVQQDQSPFPRPGPEHALLRQMEGTWEATVKMSAAPGQPALEGKGTETCRMEMGGLWLVTHFEGEFAGMPFRGHGITGYDPAKKKYTGVWVDSMSSSMMHSEGSFDRAGKVLTETAEVADAQGKMVKSKNVTEFKDKDTIEMKMTSFSSDGKEAGLMTIVYKRKK